MPKTTSCHRPCNYKASSNFNVRLSTSALDRNTEKKVQQNIDEIMKNKTSLVVAHRIETIMNASRIYLFDKG